MRNLSVIVELLERENRVVIVCGKKHIEIAGEYVMAECRNRHAEFITVVNHTDAGLVVKPGTLVLDRELTGREVASFVSQFPERIEFACALFEQYDIDCAVVDIVPWALTAAKRMDIPSFLMASFTWIEQYEGYVKKQDLDVLKEAFHSADHILYYNLVNEPTLKLLGKGLEAGYVCRPFHEDRVAEIKKEYNRPIVFLSLGASNSGLDFTVDTSGLPYDFITTGAIKLLGDHVTCLEPATPNTQDYVMAADFCIAKAGWSTVSEMMIAGVKFAVLNRPDVPEDTMIIRQLENMNAAIGIDVEMLKDISAVMRMLEETHLHHRKYDNNYKGVADFIVGFRNV